MSRLLLLIATLGAVAVAQDPTGNPLYDVQYAAEAIHRMYEASFDNIRFYSSDILNEQNNVLLDAALESISRWGPGLISMPVDAAPVSCGCGCAAVSCGCNGGCPGVVADTNTPTCGCGGCGCTGGCNGAQVVEGEENQVASCGCGCTGGCNGAQVVEGEENQVASCGCGSCGCTGGCNGAVTVEGEGTQVASCGCGCTGGCNGAIVVEGEENQTASCGCGSCGCTGGCNGVQVVEGEENQVASTCGCGCGCSACGCTAGSCGGAVVVNEAEDNKDQTVQEASAVPANCPCGCSWCSQAQPQQPIVAEPVGERLRKMMTTFNTAAIGEATRACIDTARKTLQDRQNAILEALKNYHHKSFELQLKAMDGIQNFNVLLEYDNFYEHMTPLVYDYYNYLTNEIYPNLEILVGNLEYNRDTLAVALRGCLENVSKRQF